MPPDAWTPWRTCWRDRHLITPFTRREVVGRYQGSHLGLLWSFVLPMAMLGMYTFVFGVVFKGGWPHPRATQSVGDFAMALFAGQIAFTLAADPIGRAAGLVTSSPNLVKKVIFPLHILPVATVGAALVHAAIALAILLGGSLLVYGNVPATFALAPVALLPTALLGLGVTWFLAALGVYVRDVGFVVTVALQILMFSCPLFYPITSVPETYRWIIAANPLTPGIDLIRAVTIAGELPDLATWAWAWGYGLAACLLGHAWFQQTRKGFSDVL